jgi:hypothetical protein
MFVLGDAVPVADMFAVPRNIPWMMEMPAKWKQKPERKIPFKDWDCQGTQAALEWPGSHPSSATRRPASIPAHHPTR